MGNSNKTGRKQKHFEDPATGLPVVGLSRMTDGRWRIIGTQTRFSEADPQKAIAKFRKLQGNQKYAGFSEDEAEWLQTPASEIVDTNSVTAMSRGFTLIGKPKDAWPKFWKFVASEIQARPLLVAKQTGIEWIGYGPTLKAPAKLPTFKEIEAVWEAHYKKSPEQKRRVMDAWRDFKTTTKVARLLDITPEVCITFCDNVHARDLAPKSESNMFTRIRRLFTFVKSREIAPDAMAKVVDALQRLKPSDTTVSLDPKPIARETFHKLVKAADDGGKAMLYLMLNGAFSIAEVIRIKWDEINGTALITRRKKSGRCIRVAVLWQETLDALAKLPRKGENIFVSREGVKLTTSGADKRFRKIRTDANVGSGVTSSHLRDGAASALAAGGIAAITFSICMGHSSGIKDHYIKANPAMVMSGSEAIYAAYLTAASS